MNAMNAEGRTFKGVIYFGLMKTEKGIMVIEYNARFGDPETQVVLPLLDGDLFEIMSAVTEERLADVEIKWHDGAAACIVLASGGYPKKYTTGYEISGLENCDAVIYHAGTKLADGKVLTSGGRVLGVVCRAENVTAAAAAAYEQVKKISFTDCHYRKDIGVSH